ncbi:hypothetical protein [Rubrivirga sp.]|uniref:hypothetical protein n=1 Tax=Rubrivirga sp. TaxID=1885344 RepID=UPI003B528281
MRPDPRFLLFGLAVLLAVPASAQPACLPGLDLEVGRLHHAFEARRDSLIDFYRDRVAPDLSQGGYFDVAANLYRGTHLEWAVARMDTLMQNPRGDMFWMYPFTTVMYTGQDVLPETTRRAMRDLWRTYQPYRGDTENHWALYYASMYLAAQMYPDEPAETWFTGKSSQENFDEAEEYLISWIDLTTTMGQGEYDSPHYLKVYYAPMALLYAYAQDPAMRQRAGMMLDYLTADYAAELLAGHYGGAHSRVYEREALAPGYAAATRFAGLLFDQAPMLPSGETFILAISGYEPAPILHAIASDRSRPYVHRELKRTRHRFRFSDVKNAPVYKYTFVRPEYVLGSSQGGLLQPIQQQTWGLQWAADDRVEARNTLTSLHPYSSDVELGMYFAELREFITEIVVRSKTEYDSPDKLTGGSPYEQVVQDEDVLIALYDIPPDDRFPHVNAHFSADLEGVLEDDSGWIFARGGDALIAYYPLAPYSWEDKADYLDASIVHQRLVSPHTKNGAVLQVAPASAFPTFQAFQAAVRALPLETATEPVPSVRFTSLDGRRLSVRYGGPLVVDGDPVSYDDWPLYAGPFTHAEPGSRRLELTYGPMRRLLDFNTLSVRDWIEVADSPDQP